MKAYKFRFENVLKSKQIIVDQLAAKTARARKIHLLEERKLEDLMARRGRCIDHLADIQKGTVNPVEVRRSHEYLALLGRAILEQKHTVKEIADRVEMLRELLAEAEKERKTFEKLDEKEREEYFREVQKTERAELDETGVNRFIQRSSYERFRPSAG